MNSGNGVEVFFRFRRLGLHSKGKVPLTTHKFHQSQFVFLNWKLVFFISILLKPSIFAPSAWPTWCHVSKPLKDQNQMVSTDRAYKLVVDPTKTVEGAK